MSKSIRLMLYGPNDEKVRECRRMIVPWGILKRVIRLGRSIQKEDLYDLLAEFFGCEAEELERGASGSEMMACVQSILAKARGLVPQAPDPGETDRSSGDPASLDAWMLEIERDLIGKLHWSLYELDRTDIESLFPFIFHANKAGADQPQKAYADQVDWL
jgi:hypothetical protein